MTDAINKHFRTLCIAIVFSTLFGMHIAMIQLTPWDWDEPVYTDVVRATLVQGYPSFLTGENIRKEFYSYNPPMHFYVLAWWDRIFFGGTATIEGHRAYSSVAASLVVALAMVCVYSTTYNKRWTLIVGLLLATDGWFSYTSLLVKYDTTAILIGLLGVYFFQKSLRDQPEKDSLFYARFGGACMGLAAAYKHVAAVFIIALLLHWAYYTFWIHRESKHFTAVKAAFIVVIAYVLIMVVTVGQPYLDATSVQLRRIGGARASNGLNPTIQEALQAIVDLYIAYLGSMGVSIGGTLLSIGVVLVTALCTRKQRKEKRKRGEYVDEQLEDSPISFMLCLSLCAVAFLAVIQLRNPHYLGYAIVPLIMVVGYYLDKWLSSKWHPELSAGVIVVILLLNAWTLGVRVFDFGEDTNVLAATKVALLEMVPNGATIMTSENICGLILEADIRCLKIANFIHQSDLDNLDLDAIIIYETRTYHRPQSDAISNLLGKGRELAKFISRKDSASIIWVSNTNKPKTDN